MLWILVWSGAGLLVTVFLVGYAAPYLPPARFWWTDLFAVLVPPLSVGVGLLGVGLLVHGSYQRRWGRVAGGAVLCLLVLVRFGTGPAAPAWGATESPEETLRLMTLNLPPAFARGPAAEQRLRTLVRREAPTVVSLQETWMRTDSSPGRSLAFAAWPLHTLRRDSVGYALPPVRPPETSIYQPVLGRVPLDSISVHPLPPSGDARARSRYTRTHFTWQGRPAVLYNVHLHTVGARPQELLSGEQSLGRWRAFLRTYRDGALHRAEQARQIRQRVEQETRPVLVVGDFNSTPHQWAYQHMAQGLRAAGGGATFPAWQPLVQIDHILVGPAWRIEGAHVPSFGTGAAISDHRPLVAQLRWKGGYEE